MQTFEAKKLIGHQACPECGAEGAEIKTDKSANPYRYCGQCNAQYFTRGDAVRVRNLIAKMRPIQVQAEAPAAAAPVAPAAPEAAPAPKPKVVAKQKAAPAPARRGFFRTLMDESAE